MKQVINVFLRGKRRNLYGPGSLFSPPSSILEVYGRSVLLMSIKRVSVVCLPDLFSTSLEWRSCSSPRAPELQL